MADNAPTPGGSSPTPPSSPANVPVKPPPLPAQSSKPTPVKVVSMSSVAKAPPTESQKIAPKEEIIPERTPDKNPSAIPEQKFPSLSVAPTDTAPPSPVRAIPQQTGPVAPVAAIQPPPVTKAKPPPLPAKPLTMPTTPNIPTVGNMPKAPEMPTFEPKKVTGKLIPQVKLSQPIDVKAIQESIFAEPTEPEEPVKPAGWKELAPGELETPSGGLQSLDVFNRSQKILDKPELTPPPVVPPKLPESKPVEIKVAPPVTDAKPPALVPPVVVSKPAPVELKTAPPIIPVSETKPPALAPAVVMSKPAPVESKRSPIVLNLSPVIETKKAGPPPLPVKQEEKPATPVHHAPPPREGATAPHEKLPPPILPHDEKRDSMATIVVSKSKESAESSAVHKAPAQIASEPQATNHPAPATPAKGLEAPPLAPPTRVSKVTGPITKREKPKPIILSSMSKPVESPVDSIFEAKTPPVLPAPPATETIAPMVPPVPVVPVTPPAETKAPVETAPAPVLAKPISQPPPIPASSIKIEETKESKPALRPPVLPDRMIKPVEAVTPPPMPVQALEKTPEPVKALEKTPEPVKPVEKISPPPIAASPVISVEKPGTPALPPMPVKAVEKTTPPLITSPVISVEKPGVPVLPPTPVKTVDKTTPATSAPTPVKAVEKTALAAALPVAAHAPAPAKAVEKTPAVVAADSTVAKVPAEIGAKPSLAPAPVAFGSKKKEKADLPLTRTERAKRRRLAGVLFFYAVMLVTGGLLFYLGVKFALETRVEGQVIPPAGMPASNEVWIVIDFRKLTAGIAEDLAAERAPLLQEIQERQDHVHRAQADIAVREERARGLQNQVQALKDEQSNVVKKARDDTQQLWDGPGAQLDSDYEAKMDQLQHDIEARAKSLNLKYESDPAFRSPEAWANAYRLALYQVPAGVDGAKEHQWLSDQMKTWRAYVKALDDRKAQLRDQAAAIKTAPAQKITDLNAKIDDLEHKVEITRAEEEPIKAELLQAQNDLTAAQTAESGLDKTFYDQIEKLPGENVIKHLPLLPNGRFSWTNIENDYPFADGEQKHSFLIFSCATRSDGRQYWALVR